MTTQANPSTDRQDASTESEDTLCRRSSILDGDRKECINDHATESDSIVNENLLKTSKEEDVDGGKEKDIKKAPHKRGF